MSPLRRCERCGALNNTLVNDNHCYVCGQQWARDAPAVVTDGGQCRECGADLPAGYLCPECDSVEVHDE